MDPAEVAWRSHAACKPRPRATALEVEENVKLFFEQPEKAKKICAGCPSLRPCGAWAVRHDFECLIQGREVDMLHGVWGGMDKGERAVEMDRWR